MSTGADEHLRRRDGGLVVVVVVGNSGGGGGGSVRALCRVPASASASCGGKVVTFVVELQGGQHLARDVTGHLHYIVPS